MLVNALSTLTQHHRHIWGVCQQVLQKAEEHQRQSDSGDEPIWAAAFSPWLSLTLAPTHLCLVLSSTACWGSAALSSWQISNSLIQPHSILVTRSIWATWALFVTCICQRASQTGTSLFSHSSPTLLTKSVFVISPPKRVPMGWFLELSGLWVCWNQALRSWLT